MMDPIITLHYGCVETMIEEETLKAVMKVGIEVDKERLLKALKDARSYYDEGYEAGKKDAVVHGHWEMISHSEVEPVADYACSVCSGLLIDVIDDDRHELNAYCPMCGAKMDAERKEGDRNAAD